MQLTTIVQTTASPVSSFLFQHMCYLNLETLTSRFDVIILLPSSSRATPTLGHGCPNETTPRLQAVRSCARCQAEKGRCSMVSGRPQHCESTCVPVYFFVSSSPVVGHEWQRSEAGSDPT